MRIALTMLFALTALAARADDAVVTMQGYLAKCNRDPFDAALAAADQTAASKKDELGAQLASAEGHLLLANHCRLLRGMGVADKAEEKTLRETQDASAAAGMESAERAMTLAKTPEELARAHRVLGELISHQISGPISGMRNGPKAREHLDEALKLAPQDVECRRAQAVMLLNNPAMFGGDPAAAADILSSCVKEHPEREDLHLLLALAYRKCEKPAEAKAAAQAAVALNSGCEDAARLLAVL